MKFNVSQTGNDFSFVLTDDKGAFLAQSSSYSSQEDCISIIRALIPALLNESSFTIAENRFKINVNGKPEATSNSFASNAAATAAMKAIVEDASDEAQYAVEVVTEVESTKSKFVELSSFSDINYASLYDFTTNSTVNQAGFDPTEKDGNYSFFYNGANGKTILYSRKFDTSGRRDKRIRQVIKAAQKEERFEVIEESGTFYFIIKARNMAEIGRSKNYTTKAQADADIAYCMQTIPKFTTQYPEPKKKKRKSNTYNFDIKTDSQDKGFHTVRDENKDHFFIFNDNNGKPMLYSQGYTSSKSRDNGIKTVIRNAGVADQHEIKEIDGKYYFVLRAGNRQEIARSATFSSKAEAEKNLAFTLENVIKYADKYGVVITEPSIETKTNSFVIDVDLPTKEEEVIETVSNRNEDEYLDCDAYAGHNETPAEGFRIFNVESENYFVMQDATGKVLLRSEGYPTTGARDNGLASVQKNRELPERYSIVEDEGAYFVVLKAGNHKEIARSCAYESEAAANGVFGFINGGVDVFPWSLPVVAAIADKVIEAKSDREEDNYLACKAYEGHDESPKEGFLTFVDEENGENYFAMFDEVSGKTIFRSEGYPTKGARDNGIESVIKNRGLKERYSIEESDSGYHFVILKAGNHKEIARSCGYKDKAALMALFPFLGEGSKSGFPWEVAGLAAAAAIAPIAIEKPVEIKVEPLGIAEAKAPVVEKPVKVEPIGIAEAKAPVVEKPVAIAAAVGAATAIGAVAAAKKEEPIGIATAKAPVIAKPPVVAAPVMAATEEVAAGGGIPRWLWALLAALLLAGLLWWLLRGCDNSNKEIPITTEAVTPPAVIADTVQTDVATTEPIVAPDTVTKVEEVAIAGSGTDCGCDTGKEPLFMNYSYKAKTLTKLGSNTEFGDSHALSPSQFYDKLNKGYKTNDVDRVFLDRIFKSMGYKNGWADASASMFSNTIVPYGTVGNIGYGKNHRTQYSTLNLDEHDQKAFLIKSRNGCDVRFMKTCGNHMFYCTK